MKRFSKILFLSLSFIFVTACDNSVDRADKTVTMIQDEITAVVNDLTEIQVLENNVQADFEATLNARDGFEAFNHDEAPIFTNIQNRKNHLNNLKERIDQVKKLSDEFSKQAESGPLSQDQVLQQAELLLKLSETLTVYVNDYLNNLETESIIYRSITNPDMNLDNFFNIFNRVQVLQTNNEMNLEQVLAYFEPINTQLINFKVYLVNLSESQQE